MCGIFGILSDDISRIDIFKNALDSLRHRGPDDEGYLFVNTLENICSEASSGDTCMGTGDMRTDLHDIEMGRFNLLLANRRLSIIDLSTKGHQPMSYRNGGLWITYNGEIFNYREIKKELTLKGHEFTSDTDTEVILAAYGEWGEECVNRFNGQWAFCLYDKRKKRLFCSRDRFGIKPFYYWFDGKNFAFASEMKALLLVPFIRREINRECLFDFTIFHMIEHGDETLFTGIHQLMPAHNMMIDLKGISLCVRRYYELTYNPEPERYNHTQALRYADDIRELLIDAVKVRLISDVPVGSCLSGGLDSSAIVSIMTNLLKEESFSSKEQGKVRTFTAAYEDPLIDEKVYAEEMIHNSGARGFFVYPTGVRFWREIDRFLFHQDEICMSTNVYAGWDVMRLASHHVRVVLTGQGGDELFGGYPRYEPLYIADIIRNLNPGALFVFLSNKIRHYGLMPALMNILKGWHIALIPDTLKIVLFKQRNQKQLSIVENLIGALDPYTCSFERMKDRMQSLNHQLYCDLISGFLRQLLRYDDRNASAFSIENRVPFVDHRLIEYVNSIPSVYKMYKGWSKWLLRLAMRDLLPERILWRKDKIGFLTPVEQWVHHEDSPIPSIMKGLGMHEYNPYFAWKYYLARKTMAHSAG